MRWPELIQNEDILKIVKKHHVTLVSTKKWIDNNSLEKVLKMKKSDFNNILTIPSGEPDSKTIFQISKKVMKKTEFFIAIGGGSTIDTTKMLAILNSGGGKPEEYEFGKKPIPTKIKPIIVIPTTIGSGSEASIYSVINNTKTNRKFTLTSHEIMPTKVLLEPKLCVNTPEKIIISCAMDAFIQAFESIFTKKSHQISNNIAPVIMYGILKNLEEIREGKRSIAIFKKMQVYSFLSGICISYSRTGLIHTISVALAKNFSQMHGELNSIIFPHVINFNRNFYKIDDGELDILLKNFQKRNLDSLLTYFLNYFKKLRLKLDKNLEVNIEETISRIYQDKGLFDINPIKIKKNKLKLLIKEILRDE